MNENPLIPPADRPEPEDAEGFFRRGNRHLDAGSYARAIADYTAALTLDPTDAEPYFNRGLAYRHNDQPLPALTDFHRAVELDPVDADARYQRGVTYAVFAVMWKHDPVPCDVPQSVTYSDVNSCVM